MEMRYARFMARWPTGPFSTHRTGCYSCVRRTAADGGCGVHGYPCVHRGVDLFADDPHVFAPEAGTVVAVSDGKSAPWVGYGPGIIVIKGESGVYHLLAHLTSSTIGVSYGQWVQEGQPLAQFAASYGHTHYEVRKKLTGPSETNTIDPNVWLATAVVTAGARPSTTREIPWGLLGLLLGGLVGIGWLTYRSYHAHQQ